MCVCSRLFSADRKCQKFSVQWTWVDLLALKDWSPYIGHWIGVVVIVEPIPFNTSNRTKADVRNPNVQISVLFEIVRLSNHLDFGHSVGQPRSAWTLGFLTFWLVWTVLYKKFIFENFKPNEPNDRNLNRRMTEIRTSDNLTKFHLVCQTERSDFGALLY